jgi:hypothetical protein
MPRARTAKAPGVVNSGTPGKSVSSSADADGAEQTPEEKEGHSPEYVIHQFRAQLAAGVPWHRTLLEAMGQWIPAEEWHRGRRYKYMVGREAFDWLLLAERLCDEAGEYIPPRELELLLFHGVLPEPVVDDELRDLLGVSKYRGYLNYHYGIVLEEVLQLAAEEYVRKRHLAKGYSDSEELIEEAFRHLYTQPRTDLLAEFRKEAQLGKRQGLNLSDLKEFTYWLHKRRVNYWDPARVAYDTRRAICRLQALRETSASFESA